MQRLQVGSYYTDGQRLYEVVQLHNVGSVSLRDSETDAPREMGIDAFRRMLWLVRLRPSPEGG